MVGDEDTIREYKCIIQLECMSQTSRQDNWNDIHVGLVSSDFQIIEVCISRVTGTKRRTLNPSRVYHDSSRRRGCFFGKLEVLGETKVSVYVLATIAREMDPLVY